MQWSKAEDVLSFEIGLHAEDIVKCHFRSRKACPMKWSTLF
jgi:hypothetical protein